MLYRCIQCENQKLRRSVIWSACFLIPIIPAIMGTFTYLQNLELLKSGWFSLWTQLSLFYASIFYGPLIALYASYLWRLEHLNHNWNMIMTMPVHVGDLFFGKLVIIFKVTLITQTWLGVLFFICGKLSGLPGFIPAEILFWLLRGTLAAGAVGTLQLLLSMVIRSFAVPIGIALCGSIIGFLAANKGLSMYWPYSLMVLGMNSNRNEDQLSADLLPFFVSLFLFFLLFAGISILYLKKKDIRTQ